MFTHFRMFVRVFVRVVMVVSRRSGGMLISSAARLTVMSAAILTQDHPPPQVARQFEELFRERHGLVEIGQEVAKRFISHPGSLFHIQRITNFMFRGGVDSRGNSPASNFR